MEVNTKGKTTESNVLEEVRIERARLKRLIEHHDEFFNFVNLHDSWYRWVSGDYQVTSVDSIGETFMHYLMRYCDKHRLSGNKVLSSDRILVVNFQGVYFMLRKLHGQDEFSAVSIVETPHTVRIIFWENLLEYLNEELRALTA